MSRKIIINNKEYKMPKMSADVYMDYLDLAEQIEQSTSSRANKRYTRQEIEVMMLFICKAYGEQFTVDELKDVENGGYDIPAIILEFELIDMSVGEEMTKQMEKIEKNFQSGK